MDEFAEMCVTKGTNLKQFELANFVLKDLESNTLSQDIDEIEQNKNNEENKSGEKQEPSENCANLNKIIQNCT